MSAAAFTVGFDRVGPLWLGKMVLGMAVAVFTAGCASFNPHPNEQAVLQQRAIQTEDSQYKVSVAVPSKDETSKCFDRNLYQRGIQPVWVQVENHSDTPVYFLSIAIDSDCFAPIEVAYQYHSALRPGRNAAMEIYFLTNAMAGGIPPHSKRSGFVFTHLDLGSKEVSVVLASRPSRLHVTRYTFIVPVAGLNSAWDEQKWGDLTNGMETIECDDAELRAELEKLPRATTDKAGKKEGDPLNVVIIGSLMDLATTSGCDWDPAERVTSATTWRTIMSYMFGSQYRYSPVSPLYFGGRVQDIALQKARSSIKLRNHVRLWLTPLRYHGKPVWIGQVSRDIGVRWTLQSVHLTTHKINPNVDEARAYLVADLVEGEAVKSWGYVKGVEQAPYWNPRHNLTGDPYYTDGLRVVIELSTQAIEPTDVIFRTGWESPPEKHVTKAPKDL
jgi:hypothetical protein